MTLTLHVDTARWRANISRVLEDYGDVVPVVKGNGYGFGRARLAREVAGWADEIAVGTVHELAGLDGGAARLVLTPALAPDVADLPAAVLTVGSVRHVDELQEAGWQGPVTVKLLSSMARYGAGADELDGVLAALERAGCTLHAFAVHPPLPGWGDGAAEVARWLARLPSGATVYVSHLEPSDVAGLRRDFPGRRLRARIGTRLWHGDRGALALRADVLDTRAVRRGTRAGYRLAEIPADGTLAAVGAGTAHGVHPLPDGRSPFHWQRTRLPLVEPPHMHTSLVVSQAPIEVGDEVDVQRPLSQVWVDRVAES